jgi:hypothetical protein
MDRDIEVWPEPIRFNHSERSSKRGVILKQTGHSAVAALSHQEAGSDGQRSGIRDQAVPIRLGEPHDLLAATDNCCRNSSAWI